MAQVAPLVFVASDGVLRADRLRQILLCPCGECSLWDFGLADSLVHPKHCSTAECDIRLHPMLAMSRTIPCVLMVRSQVGGCSDCET
eukprot:13630220-Alexandrium_andersonii.AAC.1